MWIDANGDQPYTGFQVYWPAYAPEAGDDVPAPPETYVQHVQFYQSSLFGETDDRLLILNS